MSGKAILKALNDFPFVKLRADCGFKTQSVSLTESKSNSNLTFFVYHLNNILESKIDEHFSILWLSSSKLT